MAELRYIPYRGKLPVKDHDPWDQSLEVGDRVVDFEGVLYTLVESSAWWRKSAGELLRRRIRPPVRGATLVLRDGGWFWCCPQTPEREASANDRREVDR